MIKVQHEKKKRTLQTAADEFWERPRHQKENIPELEPYMVVELLKAMPDGKMMEVYFSDGK